MNHSITIHEITAINEQEIAALSGLLIDVVAEGASIGFLPPLSQQEAEHYWQGLPGPDVVLFIAVEKGKRCGTVQLHRSAKANGRHRAEVAKLMVSSTHQRKGIGRKLMHALQERAIKDGIQLLVLDTREGDPSNHLYRSLGYVEAGSIPAFARSADGELHATVLYYKRLDEKETSS